MAQQTLPALIEGSGDLVSHAHGDASEVRKLLHKHGAVLFRGFDVGGAEGLESLVRTLSGEPLTYVERSSPRSVIHGNIYTSTDYPPQEEIFLHNENSYQAVWPLTLYFHCVEPPLSQGATPLADTRRILASINPAVLDEFRRRRWMVVRNFAAEIGLPWQTVFNNGNRDEVLDYCKRNGIEAQWLGDDHLRTTAVRDAVHRHPVTGEEIWFNHCVAFHVSTLPEEARLALLEMFGADNLPANTYYGDGAPIPQDVLDHLRSCYRGASVRFDYWRDDVLMVDNMLASHGREPYTGPRRIAVAMAEPSCEDGDPREW
ncbi:MULTISPECIES: TauD/TfdA family dioxygenase [Micromonospora]|uniref:TauD/TfdA family dioxygenase n=1 Tax=Micromonospora TaxID=1873 RepID=UPI0006B04476|nr:MULTISPECIES: TauD/TfdA family dioxygenase [Micromonospora]KOX07137.1 SyrP [Micromonospora sp. NRRL B-16802]NJC12921.1 alpha-ketoglutarate-dependent taurine dioxygenase [Micromonospora profundi]